MLRRVSRGPLAQDLAAVQVDVLAGIQRVGEHHGVQVGQAFLVVALAGVQVGQALLGLVVQVGQRVAVDQELELQDGQGVVLGQEVDLGRLEQGLRQVDRILVLVHHQPIEMQSLLAPVLGQQRLGPVVQLPRHVRRLLQRAYGIGVGLAEAAPLQVQHQVEAGQPGGDAVGGQGRRRQGQRTRSGGVSRSYTVSSPEKASASGRLMFSPLIAP